jgi:hypothetical protein
MQLFLGMILGSALTILGVYAIDATTAHTTTANTTTSSTERPMVNWDVVENRWTSLRSELHEFGANVQRGWHRLVN